jgi:hypothetical protein
MMENKGRSAFATPSAQYEAASFDAFRAYDQLRQHFPRVPQAMLREAAITRIRPAWEDSLKPSIIRQICREAAELWEQRYEIARVTRE